MHATINNKMDVGQAPPCGHILVHHSLESEVFLKKAKLLTSFSSFGQRFNKVKLC